jgi:hypothetical protein
MVPTEKDHYIIYAAGWVPDGASSAEQEPPAKQQSHQWHLSVSFNHPKFAMIIGKGGQTHKKLKEDHGVQLNTWNKAWQGTERAVPISGPIAGIDACMRDLSRILGETVTIVPEERDEFTKLVGRVPTKSKHGPHAGPPPLPADASPEQRAARELRLWVLNRDDKCISDVNINLFYDTVAVSLKEAVKAIKLKGLIEKCVLTLPFCSFCVVVVGIWW